MRVIFLGFCGGLIGRGFISVDVELLNYEGNVGLGSEALGKDEK